MFNTAIQDMDDDAAGDDGNDDGDEEGLRCRILVCGVK